MKPLLLAFLFTACTPFTPTQTCNESGFTFLLERTGNCSYYNQLATDTWEKMKMAGFVTDQQKPLFTNPPIYVHAPNSVPCGKTTVDGCEHLDTDNAVEVREWAQSLAHEWFHHLAAIEGTPRADNVSHLNWKSRGAVPDAPFATIGDYVTDYRVGSWWELTQWNVDYAANAYTNAR